MAALACCSRLALAEGLDLMITMESKPTNTFKDNKYIKDMLIKVPSMIVFELECRDKTDTKAYRQMQDIIQRFKETVYSGGIFASEGLKVDLDDFLSKVAIPVVAGRNLDGESHYKISEMSLHYTRKPPMVTSGGRENRRAYSKAGYGSKDKLTPGWSEAYAKLLDDVVHESSDVHCVFQSVVGGGAQTRNGKANLNAMSHRDAQLHLIVFDLFRSDDEASIKAAANYQRRFEMEVVNKHQTAHPKVMAQWASHGDLDMNKKQVWEKYIDNPETYDKLRRIKKEVDPDDVFHARFTIRPAP